MTVGNPGRAAQARFLPDYERALRIRSAFFSFQATKPVAAQVSLDVTVLTDTARCRSYQPTPKEISTMKRSRMSRRSSRRSFSRDSGIHPLNNNSGPMRGGIRL